MRKYKVWLETTHETYKGATVIEAENILVAIEKFAKAENVPLDKIEYIEAYWYDESEK